MHFRQQMRQIVMADDFLDGNFLSNDGRVPVTLLQTNACSPLATNAIADNIWDNFSSASYKQLAVGRRDNRLRSVHRAAAAVPDAGRRARLHPRAVAGQPVVDRALPA